MSETTAPAPEGEGERRGFPPWASIEAGDLKAEYDRAVEALHATKMRALLLQGMTEGGTEIEVCPCGEMRLDFGAAALTEDEQ